jgi:hypothetical protein
METQSVRGLLPPAADRENTVVFKAESGFVLFRNTRASKGGALARRVNINHQSRPRRNFLQCLRLVLVLSEAELVLDCITVRVGTGRCRTRMQWPLIRGAGTAWLAIGRHFE